MFSRKSRALFASTLASATKPMIGGQAVIEGVMMRSPKSLAVAVRTPDGGITVREEAWLSFSERLPLLKLPILRGANMLVESLFNGMQALSFSAATAFPEDEQAQAEQAKLQAQKKSGSWRMALPMVASLAFAFLLFKGVPHFTAFELGKFLGHDGQSALPMTSPWFHVVDGVVKLALFIGYLKFASRFEEFKRMWMYHGAEHKSIHVWEAGQELNVENARPKTTAHPRCGTSLMLLTMVVSFLVFAAVIPFVPVVFASEAAQAVFTLVIKLPLLLPIAGLAYEAQRLAAKHPTNPVVRALIAPGMLMQRLTTTEPGDKELEVALTALRKTVWREQGELPKAKETVVEIFPSFDAAIEKLPLAA